MEGTLTPQSPPPPGEPEVVVEVPPELVPYEPETGHWDPHLGRMAWARIHVQAQGKLYEPTSHLKGAPCWPGSLASR